MVDKKIIIIVTIITIIVVGLIVGYGINSLPAQEYTFEEIAIDEDKVLEDNDEENVIEDKKNNDIVENEENENSVSKDTTNSTTDSSSATGKSDEDIAIELAKKEWGENDSKVYFYVEEKLSSYRYVVSVRSKENTAGLMDYEVNINTKKVQEY